MQIRGQGGSGRDEPESLHIKPSVYYIHLTDVLPWPVRINLTYKGFAIVSHIDITATASFHHTEWIDVPDSEPDRPGNSVSDPGDRGCDGLVSLLPTAVSLLPELQRNLNLSFWMTKAYAVSTRNDRLKGAIVRNLVGDFNWHWTGWTKTYW